LAQVQLRVFVQLSSRSSENLSGLLVMVVVNRIVHLKQLLQQGAKFSICFNVNPESQNETVKVTVDPSVKINPMQHQCGAMALEMLEHACSVHHVADRGHKASNGVSTITFYISYDKSARRSKRSKTKAVGLNPNADPFIPVSTSVAAEQPSLQTTVQAAQEELNKNKGALAEQISRMQNEILTIHDAIMKFHDHCAKKVNEENVNSIVARGKALVAKSMTLQDCHLSSSDIQGLCNSVIGERDSLVEDFQSILSRATEKIEAMESSSSLLPTSAEQGRHPPLCDDDAETREGRRE